MSMLHTIVTRASRLPDAIAGVALDSGEPATVLALLDRDDLTTSTLERIGQDSRARIRTKWLSRNDVSNEQRLCVLRSETRLTVLAEIGGADGLPADVYQTLSQLPSPLVAGALLTNPNCPAPQRAAAAATLATSKRLSSAHQITILKLLDQLDTSDAAVVINAILDGGHAQLIHGLRTHADKIEALGEPTLLRWLDTLLHTGLRLAVEQQTSVFWCFTVIEEHLSRFTATPERIVALQDRLGRAETQAENTQTLIAGPIAAFLDRIGIVRDNIRAAQTANVPIADRIAEAVATGNDRLAVEAIALNPEPLEGIKLQALLDASRFGIWLAGWITNGHPDAQALVTTDLGLVTNPKIGQAVLGVPKLRQQVADRMANSPRGTDSAQARRDWVQQAARLVQGDLRDHELLWCPWSFVKARNDQLGRIAEMLADRLPQDTDTWAVLDKLEHQWDGSVGELIETCETLLVDA